ncbi:MAG TPA: IS200/IS605 family transposase [Bacteroidales bacterium]|nr:IS200/IS605 family transposase [Bacteroidales bacterium]
MKPGRFTQLYIMLVLAVKRRESLLTKDIREQIFEYMGGIVTSMKHKSIIVGGISDHVHILIGLNPDVTISDTIFNLKRGTSLHINEKKLCHHHFSWQDGYGAFSYGHSQLDMIFNYIKNQEAHHARETFRKEYLRFLKEYNVVQDEKYVFDFFEEDDAVCPTGNDDH